MKKSVCTASLLILAALVMFAPAVTAEDEDWKSLKKQSKRLQIVEMAEGARDELLAKSEKASLLYEYSYGWAVFDNLKLAFVFSGGGGNGVAMIKESGKKTFMKMGTAGIGFGLGVNKYQVVFFFQDQKTFRHLCRKRLAGRRDGQRGRRESLAPRPRPNSSTALRSTRSPTRASCSTPTSRERSTGRTRS